MGMIFSPGSQIFWCSLSFVREQLWPNLTILWYFPFFTRVFFLWIKLYSWGFGPRMSFQARIPPLGYTKPLELLLWIWASILLSFLPSELWLARQFYQAIKIVQSRFDRTNQPLPHPLSLRIRLVQTNLSRRWKKFSRGYARVTECFTVMRRWKLTNTELDETPFHAVFSPCLSK